METPSLQKATNKGVFKSFDVEADSLTVSVPVFNQDTGVREDLDINYNPSALQGQAAKLEKEITEKRREKNQILALLEKFQPEIDAAKSAIVEEQTIEPVTE